MLRRAQEHHGEPLHAIEFNHIDSGKANLFATVGSNQVQTTEKASCLSAFPRCALPRPPHGPVDCAQATIYDNEHFGSYIQSVQQFVNAATENAPGGVRFPPLSAPRTCRIPAVPRAPVSLSTPWRSEALAPRLGPSLPSARCAQCAGVFLCSSPSRPLRPACPPPPTALIQDLTACCWLSSATRGSEQLGDSLLAVGGSDAAVLVISMTAGAVVTLLKGHTKEVIDLAACAARRGEN